MPFVGTSVNGSNLSSVWEWVDGCSLYSLLRAESLSYSTLPNHPITLAMLVDIAIQVAEALAHLHHHHVLHQSLSTHDVLIAADGSVRVSDYGLETIKRTLKRKGYANRIQYSSPEALYVRSAPSRTTHLAPLVSAVSDLLLGRSAKSRASSRGRCVCLWSGAVGDVLLYRVRGVRSAPCSARH